MYFANCMVSNSLFAEEACNKNVKKRPTDGPGGTLNNRRTEEQRRATERQKKHITGRRDEQKEMDKKAADTMDKKNNPLGGVLDGCMADW